MPQWTWSSLLCVVACCLSDTKPLPEPMLTYWHKLQWNMNQNTIIFIWRKCIWKCHLQNVSHFVQEPPNSQHEPRIASSNTERTMNYARRKFQDWLAGVSMSCDLETVTPEQLNTILVKFYREMSHMRAGRTLREGTLRAIRSGLQLVLSQEPYDRPFNIIKDKVFSRANSELEKRLQSCSSDRRMQRRTVSVEDIQKLASYFVSWATNPTVLVDACWFNLCCCFGPLNRDSWVAMTKETFEIVQENGEEYVQMVDMKTRTTAKQTCLCIKRLIGLPVEMFKLYMEKRDPDVNRFFQHPQRWLHCRSCWFRSGPMGKNPLGAYMEGISQRAHLSQVYNKYALSPYVMECVITALRDMKAMASDLKPSTVPSEVADCRSRRKHCRCCSNRCPSHKDRCGTAAASRKPELTSMVTTPAAATQQSHCNENAMVTISTQYDADTAPPSQSDPTPLADSDLNEATRSTVAAAVQTEPPSGPVQDTGQPSDSTYHSADHQRNSKHQRKSKHQRNVCRSVYPPLINVQESYGEPLVDLYMPMYSTAPLISQITQQPPFVQLPNQEVEPVVPQYSPVLGSAYFCPPVALQPQPATMTRGQRNTMHKITVVMKKKRDPKSLLKFPHPDSASIDPSGNLKFDKIGPRCNECSVDKPSSPVQPSLLNEEDTGVCGQITDTHGRMEDMSSSSKLEDTLSKRQDALAFPEPDDTHQRGEGTSDVTEPEGTHRLEEDKSNGTKTEATPGPREDTSACGETQGTPGLREDTSACREPQGTQGVPCGSEQADVSSLSPSVSSGHQHDTSGCTASDPHDETALSEMMCEQSEEDEDFTGDTGSDLECFPDLESSDSCSINSVTDHDQSCTDKVNRAEAEFRQDRLSESNDSLESHDRCIELSDEEIEMQERMTPRDSAANGVLEEEEETSVLSDDDECYRVVDSVCGMKDSPIGVTVVTSVQTLILTNKLRLRQNDHRYADDNFKCIFFIEKLCILIRISLEVVPKGPISNIPALVQVMAWHQTGNKPLSESMMA